ncbi:uncharacterized protein si:ch211-198p11.6 isoform X2 [Sebastes umbrosus]|uniref:uncharacterized protein si:ch211-198p11.6 isoform X2 n=1 Tax=Sebastes umbrosus TaxID=72105 RepID=UPI00189E6C21|nr:uncharacterized protein si:ch211-198p11.6 isoform X2 [Sebastes umbrosus]
MHVLSIWELSIPLPAVLLITVSLYMIVLGVGLWIRYCLKDRCSPECGDCCPNISICDQCFRFAQMCDYHPPTIRSCRAVSCPSSCARWDCACTCQPPECESCNCLLLRDQDQVEDEDGDPMLPQPVTQESMPVK